MSTHPLQSPLCDCGTHDAELFDTAPVGIFRSTPEGRYLFANTTLAKMYGYDSPEQLLHEVRNIANQLYADPGERERLLARLRKDGCVTNFEARRLSKSGETIWVSLNMRLHTSGSGETEYITGFSSDITERKRAEESSQTQLTQLNDAVEELRHSQEMQRGLFMGLPVFTLVFREQGGALLLEDYNKAAHEQTRGAVDTIKGMAGSEIFKDRPDIFEKLCTSQSQKRVLQVETPYKALTSGQDMIARFTFTPLADTRVMVSVEDLTEIRQAEQKLKESESKYRSFFASAGEGIFLCDDGATICDANQAAAEILGYASPRDLVNLSAKDIVHPDDLKSVTTQENIQKVKSGGSIRLERRYRKADGTFIPVALTLRLLEGFSSYHIIIFTDLSEQRSAQRKLQKSEARLRAIFEATSVPMAMADEKGTLIYVNAAFESALGYEPGELPGHNFREITHPCDLEKSISFVNALKKGESSGFRLEKRYLAKHGNTVWLDLSVTPVHDAEGSFKNFVIVGANITQRKLAEESLQRSEAILNRSQAIAHVGGWELDLATGRQVWTAETYAIHEVEPEYDPNLEDGLDFFEGKARMTIETAVQRCAEQGEAYDLELQMRTAKGRQIWVRAVGQPVVKAGKRIKLVGIIQDITARKESESRLRAITERLQLATESAAIGIWDYDITNDILIWDERMHDIYGVPPEQFTGHFKDWAGCTHPLDTEKALDAFQAALAGEAGLHTRFRILRPSGDVKTVRHIEVHAVVEKDASGRPLRVTGCNWDCTEEFNARQDLERIFTLSPDMICVGDLQNVALRQVNPAFTEVLGYDAASLMHTPFLELVHPEDVEKTQRIIDMELRTGNRVLGFENRMRRNDGQYRWLRWVAQPVPELGVVYAMAHDITENIKALQALQDSESRGKAILDAIPDILFHISHDGIFLDFWGERHDLLDPSMGFLGQSIDEALPPELAKRTWKGIRAIQAGFQHETFTYPLHINGGTRHFEARIVPLSKGSVLVLVRNVTNLKASEEKRLHLERQLRQAQKMEAVGTLAGGIAHDFNNILAAIVNLATLAKNETQDETLNRDLDQMLAAAMRGRDLVKQILFFSRQSTEEQQPLDFGVQLKEIIKFLKSTFPSETEIRQEILADGKILISPTHLHQIIVNICTNALDAMEGTNGTLTLRLAGLDQIPASTPRPGGRLRDDSLVLSITDSGPGIDPSIEDKIFDPFFTTKPQGQGTGLGLSVVHGLVKEAGGEILLENLPGTGCTFHVFLPKLTAPHELFEKEESSPELTACRVLIVDDEEIITDSSVRVLQMQGYLAEGYTDPVQGLEVLRNNPDGFDIVVVDLSMPQMSGKEFIRGVRQINRELPVILCSGYAVDLKQEETEELGIAGIVQKPIRPLRLMNEIQQVLKKHNA